ncbi:unnamed protein product [Pleuronectes platessa]|uniref:Uncharacterized protein n=1 Tax=Pleuronectes platessa TaxID=8262 RepID=A0A9N7U1E7_PLEPL|nr:unnamed protein product [Pleuronectes platessa]
MSSSPSNSSSSLVVATVSSIIRLTLCAQQPDLNPLCLGTAEPKRKRREQRTRSGEEEGRRHYRKPGRKHDFHTRDLLRQPERDTRGAVSQQKPPISDRSSADIATSSALCCVRGRPGPAAAVCRHNNGQNNYRKSNVVNRGEDD